MLGFAVTGSFCNFENCLKTLESLTQKYDEILPILSYNAYSTDTRFGTASYFVSRVEKLCCHEVVHTLTGAEPLGPKIKLDCLCICPCTGNTLSKLASGIYDTPVTLAAKAHLRNEAPIILAVSTNDALAGNAANIGTLLNRKHYYFVPFRQDSPQKKPRSMVADFSKLTDTVCHALQGEQIQPILL